jgi:hypothetical protein
MMTPLKLQLLGKWIAETPAATPERLSEIRKGIRALASYERLLAREFPR